MSAICAALETHLSVVNMNIQERYFPVGDGDSDVVQRVSLPFTADKSFLEHASVGPVQKFHDGPWWKGLQGIGEWL